MNLRTSLCNIIALLLCLNSVVSIALVDTTFNSDVNGNVTSIVPQPDGKLLIAGSFTSVSGVSRNGLARLNPDGSLDTGFNPEFIDGTTVRDIVLQPDGRLIVAGLSVRIGETNFVRLNADGSLDATFSPPRFKRRIAVLFQGNIGLLNVTTNASVDSIVLQADGKFIVGGNFMNVGGVGRNLIARLNVDGSLDTDFNLDTVIGDDLHFITQNDEGNSVVNTVSISKILPQSDGKLLLRGNFKNLGGVSRDGIARLNADGSADGSLDEAFDPNVLGSVFSIAPQPDGKVLIAGTDILVGYINQGNVTRLNADGSLDTDFNPNNVAGTVFGTVPQADGKLVIYGLFNTVDGVSRDGIARLNSDGSLDTNYNPNASDVITGSLIVLQTDGKLLLGGGIIGVKRLNAEGDLQTQSVSIGKGSVTWLRGGSAIEINAATLEVSTDRGENWSSPTSGRSVDGGWSFDVDVTPSAAYALRFRGIARVGRNGSSSMIVETVERVQEDQLCLPIKTKINTIAVICL